MLGRYSHWKRSFLRRRGQDKVSIAPSLKHPLQINILQYPSSRSLPSSMIWWLKSMTSMKMTMSIAETQRNKWKRNFENHCTDMPFPRVQMSASKASSGYPFVNMSTGWLNVQPYAGLHTLETSEHQDQVKVLIERTASSLDDSALKMLFVSVQQNNIELCIRYAIDEYVTLSYRWGDLKLTFFSLTKRIGVIDTVCPHLRIQITK